ncbi:MAG: hypothetical protein ACPG5T_09600 [Endozoicomonas sp.]
MLPVLLNMNSVGGTRVKYQVIRSQVLRSNRHLENFTPKLWDDVLGQLDEAMANGWLKAE